MTTDTLILFKLLTFKKQDSLNQELAAMENGISAAYDIKHNLIAILDNLKPDLGSFMSIAGLPDGNEDYYESNHSVNSLKLNIEQNIHKFNSPPVGPLYQLLTITVISTIVFL